MAATALNLLTAALSQTGLPADAISATGTGGQTDTVAGLFQSVLASAVTQATAASATQVPITADATTSLASGQTDLLTQLLGLIDPEADAESTTTDLNPDLLAQLLAALGVNTQQLASLTAPLPTDTSGTGTATAATQTTLTAQLTSTTITAAALTLSAANPPALPTPAIPTTQTTVAPTTLTTVAPTTVPLPAPTTGTVPEVAPQAATVADANRVAGRAPAVVLQTPVDPGQRPPAGILPVGSDEIQPPVNELTGIKGLPPVVPGDGAAATRSLAGELPPPTPVAVLGSSFPDAVDSVSKATATVPTATVVPAATELARPSTTPATVAGTTPPTPRGDLASRLSAPPATAAPARIPTPDIAITAAQPVAVATERIDVAQRFGFSGLLAAQPRIEEVLATRDGGTVQPVGLGPISTPPGFSAVSPTDATAPAPAVPPAPVAEQLSGPITAHLRTRPSDGETEIQIRLDPPELGTVKLKIVSSGGDVRAELHVSSDAVRRVVESQLPELRQKLDDAGVKVQRFDVTADPQGGAARDDRGERWRETPPLDLPPPPTRPRRPGALPSTLGRVDVSV